MDLCAGLLYGVMMIVIWLDDAGLWKWLKKNQMKGWYRLDEGG